MPGQASPSQALAFVDEVAGLWGVALLPPEPTGEGAGDPGSRAAVLGMGPLTGPGSATVATAQPGPDGKGWSVSSDAAQLLVSPPAPPEPGELPEPAEPAAEPPRVPAASGPDDRICQVDGDASLADGGRPLSATGVLIAWPELDGTAASLRAAIAAFGPDDALSLRALRPANRQGHDHDVVTASVLDGFGATVVEDPRLSTTYDTDGFPLRASLELWIATGVEGGAEYPRRATGEASGGELELATDSLILRAYAMRWHSRSRPGFGPYLLVQPR